MREAGLEAIAEVPVDILEGDALIASARRGGLAVDRLTVNGGGAITGTAVVERAIALQRALGGFRAFAPLPTVVSVAAPTTGYDDVKMIALARVVAENIPNIQVDWALYGPKMAQVALTVGADDVDNVSAVDPGILGTRRSPLEEIKTNIKAAALDPLERDGMFLRL